MNTLETHSRRTTCRTRHICSGCNRVIEPGVEHYDHELFRVIRRPMRVTTLPLEQLGECMACAARNGRPGAAEPDVAEQPLAADGIA